MSHANDAIIQPKIRSFTGNRALASVTIASRERRRANCVRVADYVRKFALREVVSRLLRSFFGGRACNMLWNRRESDSKGDCHGPCDCASEGATINLQSEQLPIERLDVPL